MRFCPAGRILSACTMGLLEGHDEEGMQEVDLARIMHVNDA